MTMRKAVIWSALMHIVGVAVMWFGVPTPGFEMTEQVVIVAVDIADFSETTARKAPKLKPKPKPPEPVEETPPAPPPPPKEPDLAMIPPPPSLEPVPETALPTPAPAEAEEEKPKSLLPARPRPKPKPPKDDFVDNMLKTIDLTEDDESAKKPPPEVEESDDFLDDLATVLDDTEPPPEEQTQMAPVLGNRLTASEEDALRRQFRNCWNTAALVGARNPEELTVTLRLRLDRDGTVISVKVDDTARQRRDRFFRAAADTARRAVQHPRCNPLPLPAGKYDEWKDIVLDFNPADMVGR